MRNPIQLLNDSLSLLKDNLGLFFGIIMIPVVLSVLVSIFEPAQDTGVVDAMEWFVFAGLTLLTAIVNVFMGIALILALNNRSLSVKEAYSGATAFFWRYLGLSILTSIIITVGFILLIIPGVLLSVWLTFATFILVLERTKIVEAMKKSREYVRGRWWGVFGRLVAGSFMALLILAILFAVVRLLDVDILVENMIMTFISMLLAPVVVGYMYLMYQDLKGGPAIPAATPVTPEVVNDSSSVSATTT